MTNTTPNIPFYERVEDALQNTQARGAFDRATKRFTTLRATAFTSLPSDGDLTRDRARAIRAETLSHLDQYLAQFADAVEAAGGRVHWAADAAEAQHIIGEIVQVNHVQRVVKSKSMVSEEIHLNHALEALGCEVIESDLGEYIIQLAGETPSHIITPVIHKTKEQVGALLRDKINMPPTEEAAEMTAFVRAKMREIFLTADMGISGANFGVAATGTIVTVTNEGNGRMTTTCPRIHVAVMGIERLVPTLDDLSVMLQVLARSATGQKLSVYTNLITGPRRAHEPDGPDELHVVLIDNGRSKILGTEIAEILYCIRCGACLNACPVYREIGGHAYGSVYPGPIGSVVTPALYGVAAWSELPHASSLCGACREVCPVRIDLPGLLLKLRHQTAEAGKTPKSLQAGLRAFRVAGTHPTLYRLGLKFAGFGTRLIASRGWIKRLPGPLA
ncbi:MAG TPA: LutB/LldF family L-lactate oxidation iron-sulfur protein, partial [Anaerolineae bacterium]|nr:LutB/LldF family L-lactate oxidation iron-sulfur protein [Anaerolineae bacterium]